MKHILEKGEISHLKGGESRETFLLQYRGKKFVLRRYETKKEADYISRIYKNLKEYKILPQIYYQNGKDLLIEYIDGRNCRKSDTSKVAEQIGRICALINTLRIKGIKSREREFESCIDILRKHRIIDKNASECLKKRYLSYRKELKPERVIDFDDVYPKNFRLRRGRAYLVDLEDFEVKIKGSCIGKAFLRWFKKPLQRKRFLDGYSSVSSSDFLTEEYMQFLYLNFTLYIVSYKLKYNKPINPKDLRRLHELSKGKKITN
jgi:hypothetical protein